MMIGDVDHAISDLNSALNIDPDISIAILNRGVAGLASENFGAAVSDFTRAVQRYPRYAYAAIRLYVARAHLHDATADRELKNSAARMGHNWPYPIVELYLQARDRPESIDLSEIKKAAETDDKRCEAEFYVGEWQQLRQDDKAAAESMNIAANICPHNYVEWQMAQAIVKRPRR